MITSLATPGLPLRRLGQSGMQVSPLGYGSMGLRGPRTWGVRVVSDQAAEHILHAVLDAGINFIDTAPVYGLSEQRIGRFLSGRRDEFWLATKCGRSLEQHADHVEIIESWEPDAVERSIATSLSHLQTDRIDLMQFHGGNRHDLEDSGVVQLLQRYQAAGAIKSIGVSTMLPNATSFVEAEWVEVLQLPFSCLAPEHGGIIRRAAELGKGVIIRGGIAHGGPQATIQRQALNAVWQQAALDDVVGNMTPAQLILRYTLTQPGAHCTIVGTCNADHLRENLQAAGMGPLPDETYQEVSARVAAVLESRRQS